MTEITPELCYRHTNVKASCTRIGFEGRHIRRSGGGIRKLTVTDCSQTVMEASTRHFDSDAQHWITAGEDTEDRSKECASSQEGAAHRMEATVIYDA